MSTLPYPPAEAQIAQVLLRLKYQDLARSGIGLPDFSDVEFRCHSQNGEDGIIASIFEAIGPTNRFFAEIGCENGDECNTRKLSEIDGWSGIRIDDRYSDPTRHIYQHTVSPENVTELLLKYGAPEVFDLFSVDVDFFDFHILQAVLTKYKPRVIVSEYNSSLGPQVDCVVPYIPGRSWDRTNFFGASYTASDELGRFYGYKVVHCDVNGVNIFLVKNELLTNGLHPVWLTPT